MEKGTFFLKKEKILKPSKRELVKCTLLKKAGHTDFLNLKNYIKLVARKDEYSKETIKTKYKQP